MCSILKDINNHQFQMNVVIFDEINCFINFSISFTKQFFSIHHFISIQYEHGRLVFGSKGAMYEYCKYVEQLLCLPSPPPPVFRSPAAYEYKTRNNVDVWIMR